MINIAYLFSVSFLLFIFNLFRMIKSSEKKLWKIRKIKSHKMWKNYNFNEKKGRRKKNACASIQNGWHLILPRKFQLIHIWNGHFSQMPNDLMKIDDRENETLYLYMLMMGGVFELMLQHRMERIIKYKKKIWLR